MMCQDLILSWSSLPGNCGHLHFMVSGCYQRSSDASDSSGSTASTAQDTLQPSGQFSQYLWKRKASMCQQRPGAALLVENLQLMQCQMVGLTFLSFVLKIALELELNQSIGLSVRCPWFQFLAVCSSCVTFHRSLFSGVSDCELQGSFQT